MEQIQSSFDFSNVNFRSSAFRVAPDRAQIVSANEERHDFPIIVELWPLEVTELHYFVDEVSPIMEGWPGCGGSGLVTVSYFTSWQSMRWNCLSRAAVTTARQFARLMLLHTVSMNWWSRPAIWFATPYSPMTHTAMLYIHHLLL